MEAGNQPKTIPTEVYMMPSNTNLNYWDSLNNMYKQYTIKKPIFFNLIKNEMKKNKNNQTYWLFVMRVISKDETINLILDRDPITNYASTINKIPLAKEIDLFSDGEIVNSILSFNWGDDEFEKIINNPIIKAKIKSINNAKLNKKISDFEKNKVKLVNLNQSQKGDFFNKSKFGSKVVKATKKSEDALTNVGFRKTVIGKPSISKGDIGFLKYSVLDNIVNKIGLYQQVSASVFSTLKNILKLTNSSIKEEKAVLIVNVEFLSEGDIFYKISNSNVLYWGKSNVVSKYYIPEKYGKKIHLTDLKPEDETIIKSHGYNPDIYKAYEYKLVIRK